METSQKDKLGVAVVGLGTYSNGELKKSFKITKDCKLAGVVSGSPDKRDDWKREFNLNDKNIYDYDNFDLIKNNSDIDIVYVFCQTISILNL
jgi:glucose-fructose oxidoreductase